MLFKHIEPAIHLIQLGENQILESRSLGGGQLRIGASDTICRYYLVPYLNEFHMRYPNVHIKVTNDTSLRCVELLASRQSDLIIVNTPNGSLHNLPVMVPLHKFHDVFIASKRAFPELISETVTLSELQAYPILMLDKQSATSEFLHQIFRKEQVELAPAIELSSNDLLIDLARIGLGIAFVPDFCLDQGRNSVRMPMKKEDDDLFVIQTKMALPSRTLYAACNDSQTLEGTAGHFLKLLNHEIPIPQ